MCVRLGTAVAVLLFAALMSTAFAREVCAQEDGGKEERSEKRAAPRTDANTGKRLNEAFEKVQAEQFGEARAVLAKLNMDRLSPYELSRVEQLLAIIDRAEEKYGSAREHLVKALASGGLNEQEASSVRFQIAQLYLVEERWKEAVKALNDWFASEPNPNAAAYYTLAVAYYQLEDYKAALEPAQKAIDLSHGKAQESWLQLVLALRVKREEYQLALPILRQLLAISPGKKNYWLQFSSIAMSLNKYDEAALAMQLAHNAGLLTQEQELRRLAELLLHVDIPYRAATVLTSAIEKKQVPADPRTFELLGNCWIAAREYDKALQPLAQAAEMSDSGEQFVRLAEVLVQREKWKDATSALRRALDKGKVKNPGHAHLLLGIALYSQQKPGDARAEFERAMASPGSRAQAEGWLQQIEADVASDSAAAAAG